jgi:hypothetical protein
MSVSRITTVKAHPALVFDSLMGVVDERGLYVHLSDRGCCQAIVGETGKPWRLSIAVTDNGFGEASLQMSWNPPGSRGAAKAAKRLEKGTLKSVLDRSLGI